jgi:hypothetical protein
VNRYRTTEDPGLWRLIHESEPIRRLTLEVFEAPGVRARTIEIVADGEIRIDGKPIMSALAPRLRKGYEKSKRHTSRAVDALWVEIHAVAQEVADASGVSVTRMRGKKSTQRINQARKVAMFLAERRLGLVHADVGKFFNRERSVVTSGIADVLAQLSAATPEPHGTVTTSTTF